MNINAAFPSKYLKHADLQGKRVRLTIASVAVEDISQDPAEPPKPVLYFKGAKKAMVLNKTNSSVLVELYGEETDHWAGKPIVVAPSRTPYQGKMVDCLRLEACPPGMAPAAPPPEPAPEPPPYDDSDIPFIFCDVARMGSERWWKW